jgi:hypothetical protein
MRLNLKILLLSLCGLCACQVPKQDSTPLRSSGLPPLPANPVRSKALVSSGPEKTLSSLKLEWSFAGPVTVEHSSDLRTWSTYTNASAGPIFVTPVGQADFFRVLAHNTVTVAWDPSPDVTAIGYRVYAGEVSRQYTRVFDAAAATVYSITVAPGTTNYFAATCYNLGGLESDFSGEAVYQAPASWTSQVPARMSPN